jgi:hypothetical protein
MSYFELQRYKHKNANNVAPAMNENRKKMVVYLKIKIQIPTIL